MNKIIFFFLLFMISACAIQNKTTTKNTTLHSKAKQEEKNLKGLERLSLSGTVNLINKETSLTLGLSIKIKADSLIWFSIRAPFGVEIYRGQILNDSIFFIDRTSKTYVKKKITEEKRYFFNELEFNTIQKYIAGDFTEQELKLKGIGYEKNQQKKITTLNLDNNISIEYLKYEKIQDHYFPKRVNIRAANFLEFDEIQLLYKDIKINKEEKIIFIIPKNYVARK